MSTEGNEFVFTWTIERFHMLQREKWISIDSPTFSVARFFNTKWYLSVCPIGEDDRSDYISCYLMRSMLDMGPDNIIIEFQLSVNSVIRKNSCSFGKGEGFGFHELFKCPDPNFVYNVLVVECRMRTNEVLCKNIISKLINSPPFVNKTSLASEIQNDLTLSTEKEILNFQGHLWPCPKMCFARTRVSVERRSANCHIKDIVRLGENKLHIPVLSCSDSPSFLITLHKTLNEQIEDIKIKLCFSDTLLTNILLVCKVQVLDSECEISSTESWHLFEMSKFQESWSVGNNFQWCEMKKCENAILNFEFLISDDSYFSEIEFSTSKDCLGIWCEENLFSREVFRLYNEKKFCDVTIQVKRTTFLAHKTVLCAMSPVFSVMFESKMKESATNIVHIDDLDSDTVSKMLIFLYSGSIDELNFDEAMKLFSAADKYQISLLKNKCRHFLEKNLSVENVISILTLADAHQDKQLIDTTAYYIYKNAVFRSLEWKSFSNSNPQLALEIFQDICSKYL